MGAKPAAAVSQWFPNGAVFASLLLASSVWLRFQWKWEMQKGGPLKSGDSCRTIAYAALFRPLESPGRAVSLVLYFYILMSTTAYLLSTCEALLSEKPHLVQLIAEIDAAGTLVFSIEYALRLWSASERPEGRWKWCTSDIYGIIDLLSILPFYAQRLSGSLRWVPSLSWLKTLRALNLLSLSSHGVEFRTFRAVLSEQMNKVLFITAFLTGTVWLLCSALYYYFDHDNPAMIICPECKDVDNPASCVGSLADSCYNRMESIPSAMYFCLVNLFGEFPLMMKHTTGSQFVCIFIALVGQVLMGIPCGLFGGAFQEYAEEVEKRQSVVEEAKLSGSKVGAGYLTSTCIEETEANSRRMLKILSGKPGEALEGHHGSVDAGEAYKTVMSICILGSVANLLLTTAWLPSRVALVLRILDIASIVACFMDFRLRCQYASRAEGNVSSYVCSMWGLFDLAAWALQTLFIPLALLWRVDTLAAALASGAGVVKLVKLERFVGGFAVFQKLAQANIHVIATTGLVALVVWIVCSVAMYASERDNPNLEIRKYYTSVPAAMWLTLLNLTGECPVVDYGLAGRWITGVMGIVGVGFFTIPFGLMSGGFEDYLESYTSDRKDSNPNLQLRDPSVSVIAPFDPLKHWIMHVLCISPPQPSSNVARLFRYASMACTLLAVGQCMWRSVPSLLTEGSFVQELDVVLESWMMNFFTVEFLLRLYAAPTSPSLWSRRRYLLSFYGLIDMLTLVPYYVAQCHDSTWPALREWAQFADAHDEEFRMLRVLRLSLLDRYVPSLQLIRRVLKNPQVCHELTIAGYVGATIWFLASALLSLTERWNTDEEQRARFGTVLSAMPFTLVHLTGDYPLIDYSAASKVVHGGMLALMSGFVAVPAGVFANGFKSELQHEREADRKQTPSQPAKKAAATAPRARGRISLVLLPAKLKLIAVLKREAAGRLRVFMTLTTVFVVLVASMPRCHSWPILHSFQVGLVLLFTLDYLARLYAASADPSCNYSRLYFLTSAIGIVDLVSVFPFWMEQSLLLAGCIAFRHGEVFMLARLLTIFQFEVITGGLRLLWATVSKCMDTIIASGILALLIWLFSAVLFYEFEHDNPKLEGAMESIPSALYFTAVFLADEWAVVDFTPFGKVLMVVMCTSSLAIAALPVGCLFEAFVDAMQDEDDQGASAP